MSPKRLKNEESKDCTVDQMTSKEFYLDKNARFHLHETLIRDFVRTEAFQLAFSANKHLFRGRSVLQIGSGAGLLSLLACKAEVEKVVVVEHSKINQLAAEVIKANNFQNKISILDKKVEDLVSLPLNSQKVDVIVCDWIGYCLLHGSTLPSLITARDKFLNPDGCILPDLACLYIAGLEDFSHVMQSEHWWSDVYGFDMSCMMEASLTEPRVECVDPESVVTESYMLMEVDANVASMEQVFCSCPFLLTATKSATIHAFVIYFDVSFSKCHTYVGFSTSPGSPYTHYQQTVLYLRHSLVITEGEKVTGTVNFKKNPNNENGLLLDVDMDFKGQHSDVTDTMHYCITF